MFCPKCEQTVTEGSRFCMHCGFHLTLERTDEKTILKGMESTVLEPSEDFIEKTRIISQEFSQQKSEKSARTQKPLFFAWLVSLEGPDKGKDYRILKEKTSIGKQEHSDIVIKRDFISRNHAVLLHENEKFILTDLHSTNCTYINGEKIFKGILKDDDIIKFGEAAYKFKCL
jgi:hypothetical protein